MCPTELGKSQATDKASVVAQKLAEERRATIAMLNLDYANCSSRSHGLTGTLLVVRQLQFVYAHC
jgi:hypothetical protein